ncbi:FGGY family carbohydrate kinase [Amnibacterium sp. CER49]|uniref:xylulokinase n=1 Tax=Amnibacterium sp. CER49 TaxID=3039161 RepID=UPI00244B568C|nr:FGGY family carbohydrate kinase [Amnibacterium sp. CER49]MDH2443821.1 FGGY family carbohydrate kinase [Amnibacterium sp. CER49]
MSDDVLVGVDASTTAVKAVAFDLDGSAVAEARAPLGRTSPRPGWAEQDPRDWTAAADAALRALSARLAERDAVPVALAITHQRESFACLDVTGAPVRPAILWLDTRAGAIVARAGSRRLHELSGKPPSTTPSLYKLLWVREHEPDVLARTTRIADTGAVLVHSLTDRFATSVASADPTALLDVRTLDWSPELLGLAGVTASQLPELVPPGTTIGRVTPAAAARTGLPEGLPVVAGGGDGQVAGLGAAAVGETEAYLSLGTSITLGTTSAAPAIAPAFRTLTSPIAGEYTLEALVASGVLSLAWLRERVLGLPDTVDGVAEVEALAASSPAGAGGVLFLPYLTSAETPYWDPAARGAFIGLADHTTRAHLARAVFEGLALEVRLQVESIEAERGIRLDRVTAMGGGARSALLLQAVADALGRELAVAAEVETAALGAAILAGTGVGYGDPAALARRMSRIAATVRPAGNGDGDARFAVYRSAYPALREVFRDLAALR